MPSPNTAADRRHSVIVCSPDHGGVVAGALLGRPAAARLQVASFGSEDLADFFDRAVQDELPRSYDLWLCGPELVHRDWDGRLVRPLVMEALRGFAGTIRWFAVGQWASEDRRAVAHLIGEENLCIVASEGELARRACGAGTNYAGDYEDALLRFASGRLSEAEEAAWGDKLRQIISALKADRGRLAEAVRMLADGGLNRIVDTYAASAAQTGRDNREFAEQAADQPLSMRGSRLVFVSLSPERGPFWAEIGSWARRAKSTEFSLCRLEGRAAMILARDAEQRVDLRVWARYVTDTIPGSQAVGAEPHTVPIVFQGRPNDEVLKQEVVETLRAGSHLLGF